MTMAATIYRRMPVPLRAKAAQIRRTIVGSMPKYSATPAQTPQIDTIVAFIQFLHQKFLHFIDSLIWI